MTHSYCARVVAPTSPHPPPLTISPKQQCCFGEFLSEVGAAVELCSRERARERRWRSTAPLFALCYMTATINYGAYTNQATQVHALLTGMGAINNDKTFIQRSSYPHPSLPLSSLHAARPRLVGNMGSGRIVLLDRIQKGRTNICDRTLIN